MLRTPPATPSSSSPASTASQSRGSNTSSVSVQASNGLPTPPATTPNRRKYSLAAEIASMSEPRAAGEVLNKLDAASRLIGTERKAAAWDYFCIALGSGSFRLPPAARSLVMQFLNRDDQATMRLNVFEDQLLAAKTAAEAHACLEILGKLRSVIRDPDFKLVLEQVDHHLRTVIFPKCEANDAKKAKPSGQTAGSVGPDQLADYLALVRVDNNKISRAQKEVETLLADPKLAIAKAYKTKVANLPNAKNLASTAGEAVLRASYLTSPSTQQTYRLGPTRDAGSFSKLRDYVDSAGNTGMMRVLHLNKQRSENPKKSVELTLANDFADEALALKKANSPVKFDNIFAVTSPGRHPTTKLYLPIPDLGMDAFYFSTPHIPGEQGKYAAAAMRLFLTQANQPLMALHSDKNALGQKVAPLVHRDVKPDNIMVGKDGAINLIDFGIAAKIKDLATPHVAGTRGYIAPEYFAHAWPGASKVLGWKLETKLDVWSLAAAAAAVFYPSEFLALPTQAKDVQDIGANRRNIYAALLQEKWQLESSGKDLDPNFEAKFLEFREFNTPPSYDEKRYEAASSAMQNLQLTIQGADPAMGKLFLSKILRADPNERLTSTELHQALTTLPPLFGSQEQDAVNGAYYFSSLWPEAQQNYAYLQAEKVEELEQRGFVPVNGPTRDQLAQLPTTAPKNER